MSSIQEYRELHVQEALTRSKAPLPKRSDGKDVGKKLLNAYRAEHSECNRDLRKWHMFREIVMRSAFDVAGNRHANHPEDGSLHTQMDDLFESLAAKGITGKAALQALLDHLPTYTKGFVQTPHPTELLSREAIDAEEQLHKCLERDSLLFTKKPSELTPEQLKPAVDKMHALFVAIQPLTRAMTPDEEMTRSAHFSERMFDSLPITVQTVLDAAERHGAYTRGEKLTDEQLMAFNFLLQPDTWSPGDRDSKPDMTAAKIEEGIERNRRAIRQHYVKKLAEIDVELTRTNPPGDVAWLVQEQQDVLADVRRSMWKMIQDIKPQDVEEYLDKYLSKDGTSPEAQNTIRLMNAVRSGSVSAQSAEAKALGISFEEGAYTHPGEFLQDLEAMRGNEHVRFPACRLPDGRELDISALDALAVQANNFGGGALKSQIRENSEMHAEVFEHVLATLHANGVQIAGYDPANRESAHAKPVVEAVLDLLMNDKEKGEWIHAILQAATATKPAAYDKHYETLKGFELAAKNPDMIPTYLIAECHSDVDILQAFFLLKAMEPDAVRYDPKAPKVDIVPLVEHREDVTLIPGVMKNVYENRHFRAHHNALTHADDPAITRLSDDRKTRRAMTVGEVKRLHHIDLKAGDDLREIKSVKKIMGAGSDIVKDVSSPGAAKVQHMNEMLRETLLDLPEPVLLIDYTGSGGGPHRSQPVTSMNETVQGRSMRAAPASFSRKQLITMTPHLARDMGVEHRMPANDAADRTTLVQLNMGNVIGLPPRRDLWDKETGPRGEAWMDKYQNELYNSPEFTAYFGFTANDFVKLAASFAARPSKRIGAKEQESEFPPLVDVKKLRAIGYGGALNASGSCASMWYGASEFLKLDQSGAIPKQQRAALRDLYLNDSKAQDSINRATFGIVMADMKVAWEYLGYNRKEENGHIRLEKYKENNEPVEAEDCSLLAQKTSRWLAASKKLQDHPETLTRGDKEILAKQFLAKLDIEYQRVSKGLLQLHQLIKGKIKESTADMHEDAVAASPKELPPTLKQQPQELKHSDLKRKFMARILKHKESISDMHMDAAAALLEELPVALRQQLQESKASIDPERKFLAETFRRIAKGEIALPAREDTELYPQIYNAMGAITECFENIPRAYLRHSWALACEHADRAVAGR